MIDRRIADNLDWTLLCLTCAVTLIGVLNLFSASPPGAVRRLQWLLVGTVVLAAFTLTDYYLIGRLAHPAYAAVLLMLLGVFLVGRAGGGAQRWLPLGPVAVQPSEFAKLAIILVLARHFSRHGSE